MWFQKEKEVLKANERAFDKARENIFDEWKKEWEKQITSRSKFSSKRADRGQRRFREFFEVNYELVKCKDKHNRKKNFGRKRLFVGVLLLGVLVYVALVILIFNHQENLWMSLVEKGTVLIPISLLCMAVSKSLDIRKYQEAWLRHSKHKYQLEKEMMKYIYYMEPYKGLNKNCVFMYNIFAIWDGNHRKFAENMEKKEKDLMEGLLKQETGKKN